jgi:hypothetical protein
VAQVLLLFHGEEGERPAAVRIFFEKAIARRAGDSLAPGNSPFLREEVVMFIVTEAAGGYLTAVLDNAHTSDETAIRLVLEGNTLTPQLDNARPGDETFDHEGRMILMLDAQASQVLDDSTLDIEATDEGPKLILLPRH